MTPFDDIEPYQAIVATMARFAFTVPIEPGDLDYVRGELEAVAPSVKARVELAAPWTDAVRVEVSNADGHLFQRLYFAR